jgi:hypothetical protein
VMASVATVLMGSSIIEELWLLYFYLIFVIIFSNGVCGNYNLASRFSSPTRDDE